MARRKVKLAPGRGPEFFDNATGWSITAGQCIHLPKTITPKIKKALADKVLIGANTSVGAVNPPTEAQRTEPQANSEPQPENDAVGATEAEKLRQLVQGVIDMATNSPEQADSLLMKNGRPKVSVLQHRADVAGLGVKITGDMRDELYFEVVDNIQDGE